MSESIAIFAYGSLINEASLKRTVPSAVILFPAIVFGFSRVFDLGSAHRFDSRTRKPVCVANIKYESTGGSVNGTCFNMRRQDLENLKERERNYRMIPIYARHYTNPKIWRRAFVFQGHNYRSYSYLVGSREQNHYLRLCLEGCQAHGSEFVGDFRRSTSFKGIDDEREIWQGNGLGN